MRLLLCTPDDAFNADIHGAVTPADGVDLLRVSTAGELQASMALFVPQVVVVGPDVPEDDALECARELALLVPTAELVLVADEADADLLRAAMRAGYRDVVAETEDLPAAVLSAARAAYGFHGRSATTAAEPSPTDATSRQARVVTVFSTKGGVGKSVLASNLSVALASHFHRSVVLLDLDLHFGDMGIMLGLEPRHTIHDAAQAFDRLDADMLSGYLVPHSSGVRVLLAPVRPEDAESVTVSRISRVIGLLRDMADYVVIDTPAALDDVVLAAIDRSDTVYAIATMDVASVKNTRISLQKLSQLGYGNGLVELVLNRADSKVWLESGEIERAVERPIIARIPSDRLVPRSVNKGTPVVLDAPKSGVSKSITDLAGKLVKDQGGDDTDVAHG